MIKIVSGGQSGVDRAGLDAAIGLGLEYGGWCPLGGLAEDYPDTPGLLVDYPHLEEAPSEESRVRAIMNLRDSDATLIIRGDKVDSTGTDLVARACFYMSYPLLISSGRVGEVKSWLAGLLEDVGQESLVLNVAGPRESEQQGVYELTRGLLDDVLKEYAGT